MKNKKENLDSRDFHGYTFYEDGTVMGLYGKELTPLNSDPRRIKQGRRLGVKLVVNGKRKEFSLARLMYCLFNDVDIDTLSQNMCVTYKDNNKLNVSLDNLKLVPRKDLIQGDKHAKSSITDKQVKEIKKKYNDTKDLKVINQFSEHYGQKNTFRSLAKEYNTTMQNIRFIIQGASRNKDKYKLK